MTSTSRSGGNSATAAPHQCVLRVQRLLGGRVDCWTEGWGRSWWGLSARSLAADSKYWEGREGEEVCKLNGYVIIYSALPILSRAHWIWRLKPPSMASAMHWRRRRPGCTTRLAAPLLAKYTWAGLPRFRYFYGTSHGMRLCCLSPPFACIRSLFAVAVYVSLPLLTEKDSFVGLPRLLVTLVCGSEAICRLRFDLPLPRTAPCCSTPSPFTFSRLAPRVGCSGRQDQGHAHVWYSRPPGQAREGGLDLHLHLGTSTSTGKGNGSDQAGEEMSFRERHLNLNPM